MTSRQKQRLAFVGILLTGFAVATVLVLYALEENLLYFYTPSQLAEHAPPDGRAFNLGGMVVEGSVYHDEAVYFSLTDYKATVKVVYRDILPDLFGEGQGVIATGRMNGEGFFVADTVLAKHDENYMPPDVAEALNMPIPMKQ